jgi:hypothetical protein
MALHDHPGLGCLTPVVVKDSTIDSFNTGHFETEYDRLSEDKPAYEEGHHVTLEFEAHAGDLSHTDRLLIFRFLRRGSCSLLIRPLETGFKAQTNLA